MNLKLEVRLYFLKVDVTLCDAYAGYVCGLCGNGDGVTTNDFVDRSNNTVALVGDKYTKYYAWGSKWRVADDSSDADPST